nr:hypothetical protein [Tanacetum cinerariifolium]
VTVTSQKTNVHVPPSTGVDSCPIASGSQPMSHVNPNRISPAKGDTKLPVDDQPRKNKSHLRTSSRIDSSSRLKRTEEKDVVDGKLARLLKSSKDLENIIESQRSEKVKEGVGYNAVPPSVADLYLSPKKDLSWTGLLEFVNDTVTDYSRPSPTVASTSAEDQNKDTSTSEDVASPNPPKLFVKFVKSKDSQPESKTKEQESPKKSQVKYPKQNRHSNKRPKGNQRNWNNL